MEDEFKNGIVDLIPHLRAYAILLLRSANEADDLVQDVLVRAWRFRHTFKEGTNFKAWMFKILRNQFLSHVQKRRPESAFLGEDYRQEFSSPPEQEWHYHYRELLQALTKLPEPSRQALLLVGACGMSYEEASYVCGCATGTIKSRVSRARERLADILDMRSAFPPLSRSTMVQAATRSAA